MYSTNISKKRRRSQILIVSSDDEDNRPVSTSRKEGSRRKSNAAAPSVWLAIYEELPNLSQNEKRVLKLQTMNSFVIGVFSSFESATAACIKYIKKELDRPDVDFESIDWEDNGWFSDDLIDDLDPFQQVYIIKHIVQY